MLLFALLATATAADLVRHPYVQAATESSVVLVWTTAAPSVGEVWYGPDPVFLDEHASSAVSTTHHEVRLTGLRRDTTYFYEVRGDGALLAGADAGHRFRTAPSRGQRSPFRAWVVGDSGTGASHQADVRDAMRAWAGNTPPDLFLHMGDIAYDNATDEELTSEHFAPYADILRSTPFWPTFGNHEGGASRSDTQTGPYYDAFVLPAEGEAGGVPSGTEAYYAFDYANVHFLVLNSHDVPRQPDSQMLRWVAEDLAATDQEWVVAYWHHPPYSKGTHDSDHELPLVDMRRHAVPILEAGGVDLVLSGHSHAYERSFLVQGSYETPSTDAGIVDRADGRPDRDGPYVVGPGRTVGDGTVYVISGHGGQPPGGPGGHPLIYRMERLNGSVVLDFHENRLSVANVRDDGVVSDRFAMIKGEGLVLAYPDGGESFPFAAPVDIAWATVGDIARVDLDFSCDGGATWRAVAEGVDNVGTYAWVVPAIGSDDVRVRVRDADDASVFDASNGVFRVADGAPRVVLPFGGKWAYLADGTDPGPTWTEAGFDDASWPRGVGQLGFGEGDESAVVAGDPGTPGVYFRAEVELPADVEEGLLSVLYDDGIAVWINGTPVFANGVPDTAHDSWGAGDEGQNQRGATALDPGVFVEGTNVIAAVVKRPEPAYPALSFDLQLEVTTAPTGEGEVCGADEEIDTGTPDTGTPDTGDTGEVDRPGCAGCAALGTPALVVWMFVPIVVRRRR